MFFFFGWGRQTRNDHGQVIPLECPNCRNKSFWRYISLKTWFTIFFIPIAPYETKELLLCDVCSRGVELKGGQVEKARSLSKITTSFINKQITNDQYQKELDSIDLWGSIEKTRKNEQNADSSMPLSCPSCGKGYDNSWKMCLACEQALVPNMKAQIEN
jgi:hypothetical protein